MARSQYGGGVIMVLNSIGTKGSEKTLLVLNNVILKKIGEKVEK